MVIMCFVLLMLVCVLICQAKSRTSFALVHESLVRYKQHYGHLNVPYNFVCDNKWPKECQKLLLGQIVSRMRTRGDFLSDAKNREVVISLGLRLDKDSKRLDRFDKIICALLAFQSAYGHTQVPVNFVVPCSDRSSHVWPLECQGLRLGLAVDGIRRNGNYCQDKSRKARLEALGVLELCQDRASPLSDNFRMKWRQEGSEEKPEYSPRRQQRRKFSDHDLLTALTTFNDRYGHMAVPAGYIVSGSIAHPAASTVQHRLNLVPGAPEYPTHLLGMRLGHKVAHIRNRGSSAHLHPTLTELGFVWDPTGGAEFRALMDAIVSFELTGEIPNYS